MHDFFVGLMGKRNSQPGRVHQKEGLGTTRDMSEVLSNVTKEENELFLSWNECLWHFVSQSAQICTPGQSRP